MRFLEVPALITEDIEDPNIVDITEPITVSISGTTLTIDGGDKVSGEATITLTGDVTVNTVTVSNIKQPSIHKITIKTNGGLEFWNGNDLKFSVANWGTGKSVRFETGHLDNNSTLNNTLTNIRIRRREWDGTKYIN